MVAGMGKDKFGYEKQPNDDMCDDVKPSASKKRSGSGKCTPGRVCLNLVVILIFVFLVCSSSYFFYENCKLRRQMKECHEKSSHAPAGMHGEEKGHKKPSSSVAKPDTSAHGPTDAKLDMWDGIAKKLGKCVKSSSHTSPRMRSVSYLIDAKCVKTTMMGGNSGLLKGFLSRLPMKRQN